MLRAVKSTLGIIALVMAMAFVTPRMLRADPAEVTGPMPQVGFVVAKSIDAVQAFVKTTGMSLPPELSTDSMEKQFVFIGAGGLDTTRPIGIAVCGRAGVSAEQSIAFIFPVKPTAATIDSLKTLGGKLVPNHPDTVILDGVGLRRTAGYLIFSPTPDVVGNVDLDAVTGSVKDVDALAKLSIDFKTLRTKVPDAYKGLVDLFKNGATADAGSKQEQDDSMMFVTPIVKLMDTLDRLDIAVGNGEKGLRVALTATPLSAASGAEANRPGMPADVVARIDTNFAATEATSGIRKQLQIDFNGGLTGNSKLDKEKTAQLQEVGNHMGGLLCDAATFSLGVDVVEKSPVVSIAQHWTKPIDAPAEWKRLMSKAHDLLNVSGEKFAAETYADGDLTVTRITLTREKPLTIDVAQRNDDVFITISTGQAHAIHELLAAKPGGAMKSVFSGWVDLGKTLDAAAQLPDSPLAGLPDDLKKQLVALLSDQKVAVVTSSDGDTGTLEITITPGLLKNIPKLIETVSAPR